VPSAGGEVEVVTERREGEAIHAFPEPLPDGRTLIFQVFRSGSGIDAEIWRLDLSTGDREMLIPGNNPRYAASGHLLFGSPDARIMAATFDADAGVLTGTPTPIVEGVRNDPARGHVSYTVSNQGTLAYVAGDVASGAVEFVWVTRSGQVTPVPDGETFVLSPSGNDGWRLSPDGTRVAFTRSVDGNDDIWIKTLPNGPVSRLTFSDGMDLLPQWAPDGRSLFYRNGPLGEGSLWSTQADGTGTPTLVFDDFNASKAVASPDGEWLVMRRAGVAGDESARDIFALRPAIDTVATALVATEEFWEQAPTISRDGRWLAYSSNETGRHEVFVRPFPNVDAGKWQVSIGGGTNPVWAHNGEELFFADPANYEIKVARFTTGPVRFQVVERTTLFDLVPGQFYFPANGNNDFFDVALDDERFLMARNFGSDGSVSLVLVQNFFEELKRVVPN
jgi:serine/threonine-protein kinase